MLNQQNAFCQYYYKDIIVNKQTAGERKILQQKNIRNILVHSFEADGSASPGFYCEKKLSKNYLIVETYTRADIAGKSLLTAVYNTNGLLISSSDSSEMAASNTAYTYTPEGNIESITSYTHSSDDDFKTALTEQHLYFYNGKAQPVKMLRVKNGSDTSTISFTVDDKGNVTDETEADARGRHCYYYYNSGNQLTDVVRYNFVKKELRPDISFEYDEEGNVVQMLAVEDGAVTDYYTWKYIYNEGLRIIEKCFSKEKILLGYVEYEYN